MANVNNYVYAAKAAVNSHQDALAGLRRNAPDYAAMGLENMKQKALTKIDKIKQDAEMKKLNIDAKSQINAEKAKREIQGIRDRSNMKTKMTGKVGAAAVGLMGALEEPPKRTKPREFDYAAKIERIDQQIADLDKPRPKFTPKTSDKPSQQTEGTLPSGGPAIASTGTGTGTGTANERLKRVIRFAEGTSGDKGYNTMFGGGTFTDMSRHPDTVINAGGYSSAAAGAYQFMPGTWSRAKGALGLTDFSPQSQERAADYLISGRGVDPHALIDNFDQFRETMHKLAPEWAGLPNRNNKSHYDQPSKDINAIWNLYNQ